MKLLFLDCETGGFNKARDALLQLSGIVEIDDVKMTREIFQFFCERKLA
jgi:uncharacterized protein YprB with RNaseH-like and TPR domain